MEGYDYTLSCCVCDTTVELRVEDQEEIPGYCPMCGSPVTWEED